MIFLTTEIAGAWIIDIERHSDERGFFARTWCAEEMREHGLDSALTQCSVSFNTLRGTLRGMHYQGAPHGETKMVRCTAGTIHDVIVDLRPESSSYRKWIGVELSAANRRTLYIPPGVAHGFVTLSDGTEVLYQMTTPYVAEAARGVRWDDPAFGIEWPLEPAVISARDRSFPLWENGRQ